jgi:Ca-activated chloride channel homolog
LIDLPDIRPGALLAGTRASRAAGRLSTLALAALLLTAVLPALAAGAEQAAPAASRQPPPAAGAPAAPAADRPAEAAPPAPEAAAPGAEAAPRPLPPAELPPSYREWLDEVAVLITDEERRAFLALTKDYQRDAFIDRFWQQRDPYPETGRNELRENWDERVREVRSMFRSFDDDRSRVLLLNGLPEVRRRVQCRTGFWPMEIWFYPGGSDRYRSPFVVIFFQRGKGPFRLWNPSIGYDELVTFDRNASCMPEDSEYLRAAMRWINGQGMIGYDTIFTRVTSPPAPAGGEWVATFDAYSTDLPAGAATFAAELRVDYPGWYQNRTVLQGLLAVPRGEATDADLAGHHSYDFVLNGEVLADGRLFDNFRYKFDLPAGEADGGTLPLVFQRYLRPGDYTLVLKVEDLNSGRFHRAVEEIAVPRVSGTELPPPLDPRLAEVLSEANAALAAGETTVKVVPPIGDLLTGLVRFDTLVTGGGIDRVTFALDGRPILTKKLPPWSVELDLGEFPRTHTLRATAYDAQGLELASDEQLLNIAGSRFRIRLVEPQAGRRYERSLRARAEVEVPKGDAVERVELFLGDERVATLYQPPYVQPIVLPPGAPALFVRAVAYRTDGSSAEDVVFVNAPDVSAGLDIRFVELYASVLDRQGRPVGGLTQADFAVSEDGVAQQIRRFARVRDLPIHVGILLDVSSSMDEELEGARAAALTFFEQAIHPRDRAAIITFNDRPYLAVGFTNDRTTFAGGLAGLKAERGTALYDSLIYSLFYFTGVSGQRALLVLSDGRDESSRFGFGETLDYARRAGITIYTVSLEPRRKHDEGMRNLERLADETGGRSFFIASVGELAEVYATIQQELRSQYLVAYQSTNTERGGGFRSVDIAVHRRGVEVKTIRGYYP